MGDILLYTQYKYFRPEKLWLVVFTCLWMPVSTTIQANSQEALLFEFASKRVKA
jgi:hypothetical protein